MANLGQLPPALIDGLRVLLQGGAGGGRGRRSCSRPARLATRPCRGGDRRDAQARSAAPARPHAIARARSGAGDDREPPGRAELQTGDGAGRRERPACRRCGPSDSRVDRCSGRDAYRTNRSRRGPSCRTVSRFPAVRQNRSKLTATFSQARSRPDATISADVLPLLHGVALPRGFDTPSLRAQGGQRRPPISTSCGTFP